MGRVANLEDELPFEEKIKCLEDEELLEIWAESQQVENMLAREMPDALVLPQSYEQVIVAELSARLALRAAKRA